MTIASLTGIPSGLSGAYHKNRIIAAICMMLLTLLPVLATGQVVKNASSSVDDQKNGPVVTAGVIQQYGDYSVEDLLIRFSGVQSGSRGQLSLLGIGYNRFSASVDGQRLGSSGLGSRNIDLSALSVDVLEGIEWIRVAGADMDAEGMAGRINLLTDDDRFKGRMLSIRGGGGANPSFFRLSGPMGRASLQYREALHDDLQLSVSAGYQNEYRGWEGLNTQFGVSDFGSGPVDVVERVSPYVRTDGRERSSGSVTLRYRPAPDQHYFFRAYINHEKREVVQHEDSWSANGDWISPSETGAAGGQGAYRQTGRLQELTTLHHALLGGAEQFYDPVHLAFKAGWSRSANDNAGYVFPFVLPGRNLDIDMSNRSRPVMVVNNFNLQEDGSIDRQFMVNENFERLIENHTENRLNAALDLTLPFTGGNIKAGFHTTFTTAASTYSDASLQFIRILRLNRFNVLRERNYDLLEGSYDLPWLLNTADAKSFLESQRPQFIRNDNDYRQRSEIWNYDVQEWLAAGYLMGQYQLLRGLTLTAGARIEHVSYDNTGRRVDFGQTGNFIESVDSSASSSGYDLFPNVQLKYQPGDRHTLHAAFSRTIQRPDYNIHAPFELRNPGQQLLFQGNAGLEPAVSDNLDLFYTFRTAGNRIDVGFFTRSITNFVYLNEQNPDSGDLDGWRLLQYRNGNDEVSVYGFDVSVEQRLAFLPGLLRHFGLYANYTYIQADYETAAREGTLRVPGHSPHTVNAALFYAGGRFAAQAVWHWSDEILYDYSISQTMAPSVSTTGPVHLDQYQNGWSDLSVSGTFRISPNFHFWADVSNLLTPEYVRYLDSRESYPVSVQSRTGRSFTMGIRYDL
jgi:TonB-dependent receptor